MSIKIMKHIFLTKEWRGESSQVESLIFIPSKNNLDF